MRVTGVGALRRSPRYARQRCGESVAGRPPQRFADYLAANFSPDDLTVE
jgi:hypothetical protein